MPLATKELQAKYVLKWMSKRRAEFFAGKCCEKCGTRDDSLELHHLDQETKIEHRVWSWTKERREKELAKCIILCTPCHKIVTAVQRMRPIPHGTAGGYRRGCRCESCRKAQSDRCREYKERVNGREPDELSSAVRESNASHGLGKAGHSRYTNRAIEGNHS